jgi:2-polyprenyl-6-hydroxyphenyl methylase / 3-demethylubiquinone-9 3-methyltransferase
MDNVDKTEVERFAAIAAEWWDPHGKFRPLHQLNPVRLAFMREAILAHTGGDARSGKPFAGMTVLDVGCGGGLISEPLARMGGAVTGLDPAEENIAVARAHAEGQGLEIEYIAGTTDDLGQAGRQFDCVTALEVIEHVPDVTAFLASCAALLKPGGLFLTSTINRTTKSYALAIVAAEYIFGWLPRGTHQWNRFVTPSELRDDMRAAGLEPLAERGMAYSALGGAWSLSADLDVNYLASAVKPAD